MPAVETIDAIAAAVPAEIAVAPAPVAPIAPASVGPT